MKTISARLIFSAACSRGFLESDSRDKAARFIRSMQNPDGGFRGRGSRSDLYYTVFAVAGLKALSQPIPALKVWKYIRSFGCGEQLDLVHLVCLIRLRTAFPMLKRTRRKLLAVLEAHSAESAYDLFIKLMAEDYLAAASFPEAPVGIRAGDPTTNLAAALLVNRKQDQTVIDALLARAVESGGFIATDTLTLPDLLSTATALFALVNAGVNLDAIQRPCFAYIESLWRDSGGFVGHSADGFEDVEYTFYALLATGCLVQSLSDDYGH